MAQLTGMEIARKIRQFDNYVEIVFTTAILDYISEGYEVRAYRYLLKPLKYDDLLNHTSSCIEDIINKNKTIVIKDKSDKYVLLIEEILYIEILRKDLTIYTEDNTYTVKMSMKSIENTLLKHNFYRCHKSYLINLKKVTSFNGNLIFVKGNEIPLSRYRYKELTNRMVHILGDILC
ncbi:two-component signal transduction response regulator [[Clostridium] sordellii]|nr:two-component signal transduction response regulator [[Clostridium] sordellii] [Paeniclostridium sordellii]